MCHQDQIHILGVDNVKVGQGLDSFLARVDPAVHQHFAPFALNVDAGSADFVSCTKRSDLQEVTAGGLDLMRLYCLVELLPE